MSTRLFILFLFPAILLVAGFVGLRVFQFQQLTEASEYRITAEELTRIPLLPTDPIVGNPRAPLTIVAFEDLGCESCAKQNTMLNTLQTQYPNQFKIVWKSLSVVNLPYSTRRTHTYAYCANQQNVFPAFKDLAFANKDSLTEETLILIAEETGMNSAILNECLTSPGAITHDAQNEEIARSLQIQAVPTFFIDNKQIPTPQSIPEWERLLDLQ